MCAGYNRHLFAFNHFLVFKKPATVSLQRFECALDTHCEIIRSFVILAPPYFVYVAHPYSIMANDPWIECINSNL